MREKWGLPTASPPLTNHSAVVLTLLFRDEAVEVPLAASEDEGLALPAGGIEEEAPKGLHAGTRVHGQGAEVSGWGETHPSAQTPILQAPSPHP